jgi:hypothetical protein
MKDSVCILGQGRSFKRVKEFADKFDDILLVNYDLDFISNSVLSDPEIIEILADKNCTLFCNNSKSGFNQLAFEHFNVEKLVVNRLEADWDLWKKHKEGQTHDYMYHEEGIPKVKKDLPYLYKWRGPGQEPNHGPGLVNWPTMFYDSNNGQLMISDKNVNEMTDHPNGTPEKGIYRIYPMPDETEEYLIEPTNDRMEKNCGVYFTSLYSIVGMKKKHIYFAGIDFYDTVNDGEAWKYYSNVDRLRMEGAHMKILLNRYLPKYFPDVKFEVFTSANFESENENVIIHQKDTE